MFPFGKFGRHAVGRARDAPDRKHGTTHRKHGHRHVAGAPPGCLARHSPPAAVIPGLGSSRGAAAWNAAVKAAAHSVAEEGGRVAKVEGAQNRSLRGGSFAGLLHRAGGAAEGALADRRGVHVAPAALDLQELLTVQSSAMSSAVRSRRSRSTTRRCAMRDRFVICKNPDQAERDQAVREQLIAQLTEQIADTHKAPQPISEIPVPGAWQIRHSSPGMPINYSRGTRDAPGSRPGAVRRRRRSGSGGPRTRRRPVSRSAGRRTCGCRAAHRRPIGRRARG